MSFNLFLIFFASSLFLSNLYYDQDYAYYYYTLYPSLMKYYDQSLATLKRLNKHYLSFLDVTQIE
jgi:hypothetical protein